MRKFEESQTLELKSVIASDIKKEAIAFANTNGGEIYVGINDDGKIIGLEDAKNDKLDYESLISNRQGLSFSYAENFFKEKSILFGDAQKKTLGLISKEGAFTNLGLLLSDQCEASIKCARYMGNSKEVFMDRKEFVGSILKQLGDVFNYWLMNGISMESIILGVSITRNTKLANII